jgi:hypothetical protein
MSYGTHDDIEHCCNCPFHRWYCGDDCNHPKGPGRDASQQHVPDACPLREKPLLLRIKP